MTIQEIIDAIVAAVPEFSRPQTVDTLKVGDPAQECTGIVVTFLATVEVIRRAVEANANLIISHESPFFHHADDAPWTEDLELYRAKRHLLDEHRIAIWRFHDYLHTLRPDPTVAGLAQELGWEAYLKEGWHYQIPATTVGDLATLIKAKLDLPYVRVVGRLGMPCKNISIMPGFMGDKGQIGALDQPDIDVSICGEVHEWETAEYARDAMQLDRHKALILIGHAASEEPGMRWIIPWLQEHLPGQTITYVPTGQFLRVV